MAITKSITLIMADAEENNNKVWIGELHDNGDVITRWGRIRANMEESMQSKTFPSAGETFLMKKEKEKTKKGYVYPKTLSGVSAGSTKVVRKDNIAEIARQQLAKNRPELAKLIDRLVAANVHNITSQTNITYNADTGLFQTPLGIITQEGIDDARALLVEIKKGLDKPESLKKIVSQYLMIIPQDVGMRIDIKALFPDNDAILKQNNILDSLEASYKSVISAPAKTDDGKAPELEKVFAADLDICTDDKERKRLVDYYERTKKRMHGYDHVKVREIYTVDINHMTKAYNTKLGNDTEVYHGTSQANLLSILKSGLKVSPPSTAYIAGKMFGNGTYGAINSSKSLGYTFGRWGGSTADSGWLFVCDFAMGKIYKPRGRCSEPAAGYDSVWAESAACGLAHDELIVYKDNQTRIKYLLECK
jgi:poly [ADP-ribose] polymerase 2/3/4